MARMSSEDALNGIFNILETMVIKLEEEKLKTVEIKADETIVSLLSGIIEKAQDKDAATVGELLELLSKGIMTMKDIDNELLDHVAASIGNINKALNNIKVNKDTTKNLQAFLDTIDTLTEINFKNAEKLGEFVGTIISGLKKANPGDKEILDLMKPISNLMGGIVSIINMNIFNMKVSLNPLKGKLLGKLIGDFIKHIINAIDGKLIDESMKFLGSVLDPITRTMSAKSEFSVWNLLKFYNKFNAAIIAGFFSSIIDKLPSKTEVRDGVDAINKIMQVLFNAGLTKDKIHESREKQRKELKKDFTNILSLLTKENAKTIVDFYNTIISGLSSKKSKEASEAFETIINTIFKVKTVISIIFFNKAIELLNIDNALKFNKFITTLIKGKWDKDNIESLGKVIKSFNSMLISISLSLAIIVGITTIAPLDSLLLGVGIIYFTIKFYKNTITSLINDIKDNDIKDASKIILNMSYAIGLLTLSVAAIAIVEKVVGLVPLVSGIIVLNFAIKGFKKIISDLSDEKIDKSLKNAMHVSLSLSALILTLSISILMLNKAIGEADIKTTLTSFTILALFTAGSIFILNKLANIDDKGNLKKATDSLLKISAIFGIISIISAVLLPLIGKHFGNALLGSIAVEAILLMSIGNVKLLSNIDKKVLDSSIKTLFAVSGIFSIISIIALAVLIPIGKKAKEALYGIGLTGILMAGMIGSLYLLSNIKKKDITEITVNLALIAGVYIGISLMVKEILIPMGTKVLDAIPGLIMTGLIIAGMIGTLHWLGNIKQKSLNTSIKNLTLIAAVYIGISLMVKEILIPMGGTEMLKAIPGLVMSGLIITGLMFGIKFLNNIKQKSLNTAIKNLAIIAAIYIGISLMVKEILIPMGVKAIDALPGLIMTGLIMTGLILGVKFLSQLNVKDALWGTLAVFILGTIYLGISLIVKDVLIPIGERSEQALYGALITGGLITLMLFGVWGLSKLDGKTALYGIAATAAIAVILLGVSLITKELLIPIGKEAENALYGAGITIGLITAFGGILYIIGKLDDKKEIKNALKQGAIIVAGVSGILIITSIAAGLFIKVAKEAGNDPELILLGSVIIVGLMTAFGSIMIAVGKLIDNTSIQSAIIKGGITLMGISAVIGVISLCLSGFIPLAIETSKNAKDVLEGAGIVTLLLAGIGAVMVGVGLLLTGPLAVVIGIAIAAGAAFMAGISVVMLAVSGIINMFLGLSKNLLKYKKEDIKKTGDLICSTYEVIFDIISAAAPNPILLIEAAAAAAFIVPITGVFVTLNFVVSSINKITEKLKIETLTKFSLLIIGKNTKDKNSVLGSINSIIEAFSKMDGVAKALVISLALRPIITTISQWIDVIMKVATMSYVTGYDEKGRPEYEHLPATVFADAADVVTTNFNTFLNKLNEGFKELNLIGVLFMSIASKAIRPVITLVGDFVDVIMKVATGTYVMSYDDNGKPVYEHLLAKDFNDAAIAVTNNFGLFINTLNTEFEKVNIWSLIAMDQMSKTIKPIMDAVSTFVDCVIKVATMTVVTGYDDNGKPEFEKIEVSLFTGAGITVANTFGLFITNLGKAFDNINPYTLLAIKYMRKSISPVMDGVSKFVDAILKLATGQYIDYYMLDKDGNYTVPHFSLVTKDMYTNAAITIAENFASFIDKITTTFEKHGSFWGNKTEDALDAIGGSIKPVMEGLGTYVDAILKVATGTYVDHMEKDKDGKWVPIYKHMSSKEFALAAVNVAFYFTKFVDTLVKQMTAGDFLEKAESASEAIKNSITPIMKAVKDFSESLKPFLALTTTKKDLKPKANDYLCLNKNFIVTISKNIAESFTEFIRIIATNLSNKDNLKRYEDIKSTASTVNSVLGTIKKATGSLASIIKYMTTDDGKVISQGPEVAIKFTDVLTLFATYFNNSADLFNNSINGVNLANTFINNVKNIVNIYRSIINVLKSGNDDKTTASSVVNAFNTNMNKILNNMETISKRSKNIDYEAISELSNTYLYVAKLLYKTSNFMLTHEELEYGINKFITNVNNLTAPNFNKRMQNSTGYIKLYTTRLDEFTLQIIITTEHVEIYVTGLEKAREALASLDKQIFSKEKERNKALQDLADKFDNIANAVNNMKYAFDSLDENRILSRFDGVRALLEMINTDITSNNNVNTQNNQSQPRVQSNTLQQTNQKGNKAINNQQYTKQLNNNIQHNLSNILNNNTNNSYYTNHNAVNNMNNNSYYTNHNATNNNTNNNTNNSHYYNMMPMMGHVTFEFKDKTILGFFRMGK